MDEHKKGVSSTYTHGDDLGSVAMPYDYLKRKAEDKKAGEAPVAESVTNTQEKGG